MILAIGKIILLCPLIHQKSTYYQIDHCIILSYYFLRNIGTTAKHVLTIVPTTEITVSICPQLLILFLTNFTKCSQLYIKKL
uniref:Uncharacterized protein n=1 Tax=Lepeophtheirus salmonis TaxID=72036 RepID=A0A0K2V7U1_LEPSM